jgi:hypothetical protein
MKSHLQHCRPKDGTLSFEKTENSRSQDPRSTVYVIFAHNQSYAPPIQYVLYAYCMKEKAALWLEQNKDLKLPPTH